MTILVDNDVAFKLLAWGLEALLFEALDARPDDLRFLMPDILRGIEKLPDEISPERRKGTLKSREELIITYGKPELRRFQAYLQTQSHVSLGETENPATIEFAAYPTVFNIDEGEQTLLAATAKETAFLLTTGDKRFLKALPVAPGYETARERVRGRVVCLEQILWLGARRRGIENIRAGVLRLPDCDKTMNIILAANPNAPAIQVEEGFLSYTRALQKDSGGLLHKFPELSEID